MSRSEWNRKRDCCPTPLIVVVALARGIVADFGRSCLPGRTSRLAATSVHVNRQYRLAVSLAHRSRFACGENPFRQKGPNFNNHPRLHPTRVRRNHSCVRRANPHPKVSLQHRLKSCAVVLFDGTRRSMSILSRKTEFGRNGG